MLGFRSALAIGILCSLLSSTYAFWTAQSLFSQGVGSFDRKVHASHCLQQCPRKRLLPIVMYADERQQLIRDAERLVREAEKAAAEAENAKRKAQSLKTSALGELAAAAKKFKMQKEAGRLKLEAESRAEEATKLAAMADEAEKRGTTTLAQKLSEQSTAAMIAAQEAKQRAETALNGGKPKRVADALPFQEVTDALAKVPLVPSSASRADIAKTVQILDSMKQCGRLVVWDSVSDKERKTIGHRGSSSLDELREAVKFAEGEGDSKLGVTKYKARELKDFGSVLAQAAGLAVILPRILSAPGAQDEGGMLPAFAYSALTAVIAVEFVFARQTTDWLSARLLASDVDDSQARALRCQAAHFLVAYMCGLPLKDYSSTHVGYPLRRRPTGRAHVLPTRRGVARVSPRARTLGLPPWASLESQVPAESIFDVNGEPMTGGGYTAEELNRLSMALLAGPVAEFLAFGESSNGALAYEELDACMLKSQMAMGAREMQGQARWGIVKVAALLRANEGRLRAVEKAMHQEQSLIEVVAAIESTPPGAPSKGL